MQTGRLQHVDVWRCIAIAMVLLSHIVVHSHSWYLDNIPGIVWRLKPNGAVGVQIFFCISGFVICRGLMRETRESGGISLLGFFIRRVYRILPPLALLLACTAALSAVGLIDTSSLQISQAALFMCNIEPLADCGWALGHTWSLAYEEQFYLIFPFLAVLLGLITKPHRLVWMLAGLACVLLLDTSAHGPTFSTRYAGNFIYLLAGCSFALYWETLQPVLGRLPVFAWLLVMFSIPGLNLLALPDTISNFVRPIVFPLLICIAIFGTPINNAVVHRIFTNPVLAHFGRISYGIYLWQQLATIDYGFATPLPALALVMASVVLAHFSFQYFELPMIARGAARSKAAASRRLTLGDLLHDPLANDPRNTPQM